ncbi:MAG: hypothetical protein AB8H79_18835 [Myxococcota bacterium]
MLRPVPLLLLVAATACGVTDPEPTTPTPDPVDELCTGDADEDEDGLTDCEELELGTALHLADSDGDGFSDYREVVELGFSPENNNYKFNPRVADTPRIGINITSAPSLALLYESSTGTEKVHEVERSQASSSTVTTSESSTNSHAMEWTESVGASVSVSASAGFPGGVSGSVTATLSYESSKSTTEETSLTWTDEQSQENSEGLAVAEGLAQSEGTTISGGVLAVTVDVENSGDVAYTLSNVAISAYMSTPGLDTILSPVGGLNFDTTQREFPAFTYAPGQTNGPFVFLNDGLDTGTAKALLADSSNLHVEVVAYELTDDSGRSFTHNQTDVMARTATIIVDYEGDDTLVNSERYQVATNVDRDLLRITAWDAFTKILKLPYEMDETDDYRELISVRDVANDESKAGYWMVLHRSTNGLTDTVNLMGPGRGDYDFGSLELKSGDVLHLVYIEDEDGDGLGRRQEAAYGTDLTLADTDGDGLSDGDEVNLYKSDPTLLDSDGDCLLDGEEVLQLGTNPRIADIGLCESETEPVVGAWTGRDFVFSDPAFNGADAGVLKTTPGAKVSFELDWALNVPQADYCEGCTAQLYVGIRDTMTACAYSGTMSTGAANEGRLRQDFTAPTEPGIYRVTYGIGLEAECGAHNVSDDLSRAVATLLVVEDLN